MLYCCSSSHTQSLAIAEPLDGPLMQRYRQLAASLGLWLSVGGFQEQGPDAEHLYNCHVVINDQGGIVASYRKVWRPELAASRLAACLLQGRAAAVCAECGTACQLNAPLCLAAFCKLRLQTALHNCSCTASLLFALPPDLCAGPPVQC